MTQPSPNHIIVLLSGWPGSGKDAAASLLMEECGFTRYAFADRLRQEVSQRTGLPVSLFESHGLKDEPLATPCLGARTPRDLLRIHAAQTLRETPNAYSRAVASAIVADLAHRVVVSDWRTYDELHVLQEAFPSATIITIRITRTHVPIPTAEGEHELDTFPFTTTIANDGCVSDLRDALRYAVRPFLHHNQLFV